MPKRFALSRCGVAVSRFLVQFSVFSRKKREVLKKSVGNSQNFWSKKIGEVGNFSENRKIENFENRKNFEGFQLKIFEKSKIRKFQNSKIRKISIEILRKFFDFKIFDFSIFRKFSNFGDFFRPKILRVFH